MSVPSTLVSTGVVWTLSVVLATTHYLFPGMSFQEAGFTLFGSVFLASLVCLFASLVSSAAQRQAALYLHIAIPVAWAYSVATSNQQAMAPYELVLVAGIALAGASLCDLGLELGAQHSPCLGERADCAMECFTRATSPSQVLAACDSGSFEVPR